MTTATFTSPRHAEIVDILKSASKGMTSREIFAKAKGFEDADEVSKALNYMLKKGQLEREKVAQNTYCYWLTSSKATDSGNTLLRVGEDEPMPANPVRAVINDALKPCPEIDAVTQEMANQAEIAYQVLSEALGLTPEQMSELTLADLAATAAARLEEQMPPPDTSLMLQANRAMSERIEDIIDELQQANLPFEFALANDKYLVGNVTAIVAKLNTNKQRVNQYEQLVGQICHTLDLSPAASSMDILAEIENLSRLTDRAIQIGAREAVNGPYIIVSDPRGCAGIFDDMDEARKAAETIARGAIGCRAAIVKTVAEVSLQPVWSDAK